MGRCQTLIPLRQSLVFQTLVTNVLCYACHARYVEHVNEKLNHTNLCMDEISSFCKKKIRYVFIVQKNDFDLSKYHICFVGCKKGFVMTKIQICFVI